MNKPLTKQEWFAYLEKTWNAAQKEAWGVEKQEQKTPLKVLNLTVFTENRLRNGRVYDVETLQAMTSRDFLAIPDMGKKALKEVMEALDVYAVNISQKRVDETTRGCGRRTGRVAGCGACPGLHQLGTHLPVLRRAAGAG